MGYSEKLQSLRDIEHEIPASMIGDTGKHRNINKNETLLQVHNLAKNLCFKEKFWLVWQVITT